MTIKVLFVLFVVIKEWLYEFYQVIILCTDSTPFSVDKEIDRAFGLVTANLEINQH